MCENCGIVLLKVYLMSNRCYHLSTLSLWESETTHVHIFFLFHTLRESGSGLNWAGYQPAFFINAPYDGQRTAQNLDKEIHSFAYLMRVDPSVPEGEGLAKRSAHTPINAPARHFFV